MEDVAAEALVGKGTLYRYFRDKEDLYWALVATAASEIVGYLETALERRLPPADALVEITDRLVGYFDQHPYFFDLLQHVESFQAGERDFPWTETRRRLVGAVAELLGDEQIGAKDPRQGALMYLGSLRAVIRFGERPRPRNLARSLLDTFLHGVARRDPSLRN